MRKYITSFVMIVAVVVLLAIPVSAEDDNISFSGSRTMVCTFDRSDLNNFIDGGSKSFDEILDNLKLSWCSCETEKLKRDMRITISFSFDSKDEYESNMKELLGYRPVIIYQTGDNFIFAENFDSSEMLNFIQTQLITEDMLEELKFDKLLHIESCSITLNGETFETTDNFDVRNGNNIKFDELEISTEGKDDGSFERTIRAKIYENNLTDSIKNNAIRNFKSVGEVSGDDDDKFEKELIIKAENQYELSKKTLLATGLTVSTLENEKPQNDSVLVNCIEKIGTYKVLNDDGKLQYSFSYPSFYRNLNAEGADDLSVSDNTISYSGTDGRFEYSYERGLKLSHMRIITDLSNPFKISREIDFSVPVDTADVFEDKILSVLNAVESEYKHTKTNEYIEGDNKIYSVSYSSNNSENISSFTQSVLKGADSIDYSISIVPLKKNTIYETISAGSVVDNMVPISEVEHTYILAGKSTLTGSDIAEYTFYNNEYSVVSSGNSTIVAEFRTINIVILIVTGVAVIIVLVIFMVIVAIVKKKLKKKNQRVNISKSKKLKFCTGCGVKISEGTKFCTNCGKRF